MTSLILAKCWQKKSNNVAASTQLNIVKNHSILTAKFSLNYAEGSTLSSSKPYFCVSLKIKAFFDFIGSYTNHFLS